MAQVSGQGVVFLNGKRLRSKKDGIKIDNFGFPDPVEQMGPQGVEGFSEDPQASSGQVTLLHSNDVKLADLRLRGAVVTVQYDTGITYTFPDCATSPGDLSAPDLVVKWKGGPAVES